MRIPFVCGFIASSRLADVLAVFGLRNHRKLIGSQRVAPTFV